jgi:glycosyltransferase involved in cell wall biosynthesis
MTKVSFVVTVYNKEKFIGNVIDSLKKINGDFRKEFIIVNDGSTDKSLEIIKKHSKELPNTTIISRENKGPSISTNEGLFLAHGEYIKFLDGDDVIDPDAALNLMECIDKYGHRVAFGLRGTFDHKLGIFSKNKKNLHEKLIQDPIKALLTSNKYTFIRSIGSSTSMVKRDLIEEVGGSDSEVFVQDYSLALRCASKSDFIFCPKTVCYTPTNYGSNNLSHNKKFEALNTIQALRNFIDYDPDLTEKYKTYFYKSVISTIWKLDRKNYFFLPTYISSKVFVPTQSLDQLKDFIDINIKKYLQNIQ